MKRFVIVVDIGAGAGSSFIKLYELPLRLRVKIEPLYDEVKLLNGSGNPVSVLGRINLTVQIVNSVETVHFIAADKLRTVVILGCLYCDKHVETIKLGLKIV